MTLWICGIVGYLIVGILAYAWVLRNDPPPNARATGMLWPILIIVLFVLVAQDCFDYVANKINKDRGVE